MPPHTTRMESAVSQMDEYCINRFVDAAFSAAGSEALSYTHGDMKALIQKHFIALLRDFPSLSPSVDPFTHHRDGSTVNLLNAQGLLATSDGGVLVTLWVPQNYPFAPPTVYVFPAAPSSRVAPDHPFVDRSTGLTASPYADTWRYPLSNLSDLARDLAAILALCPPYYGTNIEAGREEATERLATRLCGDAAGVRAEAEEDIERLWAEQAVLRGRARAVDAAVAELEEERERLERALERKVRDTRLMSEWLGSVCSGGAIKELSDGEGWLTFEEGDETSRRWVENEAAELAIDDTVDALTTALEEGLVGVNGYLKQVRALAREQFFHRRMVIKMERIRKGCYSGD